MASSVEVALDVAKPAVAPAAEEATNGPGHHGLFDFRSGCDLCFGPTNANHTLAFIKRRRIPAAFRKTVHKRSPDMTKNLNLEMKVIGTRGVLGGKLYSADFASVVLLGADFVLPSESDAILTLESKVFGSVFLALIAYHYAPTSCLDY